MNTRQQFKRAVIEAIHGVPYEEAIKKEFQYNTFVECFKHGTALGKDQEKKFKMKKALYVDFDNIVVETDYYSNDKHWFPEFGYDHNSIVVDEIVPLGFPITIGRIIKALGNLYAFANGYIWKTHEIKGALDEEDIHWKSIKENGQECDDSDQSDETIDKILKLLKNKS